MRLASNLTQSCVLMILIGLIASISNIVSAQQFSENFNRSGSNPGSNWLPYGAVSSDYWFLENQKLNTGDGVNYDPGLTWLALETSGSSSWQNYRASVDIEMQQNIGLVGFAFRWSDSRNYYYASIDVVRDPGSGDTIKLASLQKVTDGRTVDLASREISGTSQIPDIQNGTRTNLEIIADGSNLSFLVNDTEIISAVDTEFSRGSIALGQSYNQLYFDDVTVTSLPGGSSTPAASSSQQFRVTIVENQDEGIANAAEQALVDTGFINVVKENNGSGNYTVFLGPFQSLADAEAANEQLASNSFTSISVQSYSPSGGTASPTPSPTQAPRATPTPYPTATPDQRPSIDAELAEIERNARNSENAGDLDVASTYWSSYIAKAPPGSRQEFGIEQKDRITAQISSQMNESEERLTPTQSQAPEEGGGGMLYIIIGVVVGIVVIIAVVVFLKKGKGEQPAAKPASKSKPADKPKPAAGPPTTKVTPLPVKKKEDGGSAPKPVTESARIKPGQVSKAPEKEEPAVPSETLSISGVESESGVDDEPVNRPPRPQLATPKPTPKSGDKTDSGLSLDFLFEEESSAEDSKGSSTEFVVPPQPDSDVNVPAGGAALPSDDPNVYFMQDFSDEKEGEMPSGWSGEYDYANLKVVKDDARAGGKCLRFEKTEGTGSALFTLTFPEASGRVIVEFDIRCDEKNKYLLGFYIEKDSNFRQSVSTIVHRTNSKTNPTLRLQNESTPYEFGQWSHVKYDIDLPRHLVDGYVDDKSVIATARLASAPKVLNTMSIRDNLATTGTLLIRDIKVYRA